MVELEIRDKFRVKLNTIFICVRNFTENLIKKILYAIVFNAIILTNSFDSLV